MTSVVHPTQTIVVGSGIIGIACAHYLSRAGRKVTVIDRDILAGACSHANCGFICPSHVLPLTEPGAISLAIKSLLNPTAPFRIKPQWNPALWHWLWQFARRCNRRQMIASGKHLKSILDSSLCEYRQLIAEENLDCEWKTSGLLYVMRTQAGFASYAATDQLLAEQFGIKAQRISGADLPEFEPALKSELAGGYFYADDAAVRPDRLNSRWIDRLKKRGVTFIENCALHGLKKERGSVTHVLTSHGEIPSETVILAVGAWSSRLPRELGVRVPIQPGKGYSVTMSRPSPCPRHPILFPEHKVGVTPFEGSYRLGSMMEFVGYDTSIPQQRISQLRETASHYLHAPFTEETIDTWYGWRPMTWDSLPIIGPVPGFENAFLATGHNMLGLSMAAATGRLICEMVRGQPTHIDATAFSPARF